MRCPSCDMENKDVKKCKKCGFDLSVPQVWKPTWKWHIKTLIGIYIFLGTIYIILRIFVA